MDVTVTPAPASERPLFEGMLQLYVYDFSEMDPAAHPDDFDLRPDGTFGPYPYLDAYWREPARIPLIVRTEGKVAGFAMLNDHGHSGRPVDRNIAEFFIMRKFRRGGVASAAVRAVLTRYPGVWEAAIMQRNRAAQAFWPRAIQAVPGVRDFEQIEGDGKEWTGPICRFRVEA